MSLRLILGILVLFGIAIGISTGAGAFIAGNDMQDKFWCADAVAHADFFTSGISMNASVDGLEIAARSNGTFKFYYRAGGKSDTIDARRVKIIPKFPGVFEDRLEKNLLFYSCPGMDVFKYAGVLPIVYFYDLNAAGQEVGAVVKVRSPDERNASWDMEIELAGGGRAYIPGAGAYVEAKRNIQSKYYYAKAS